MAMRVINPRLREHIGEGLLEHHKMVEGIT
jgi:hypothetical protein